MAEARSQTGRELILSALRKGLLSLTVLAAATYAADYGVLRIRIATGGTPFGKVTVRPLYAVPQKNNRTEYLAGDAQDQTCVHSLFPHLGDSPCWYLERHKEQLVDM